MSVTEGMKLGALVTSHVVHAGQNLEPKYAAINASNSGDNTVVAAVSGKKIRVLSAFWTVAGAVTVTWKSGSSTSLTGGMTFAQNSGLVAPLNQLGYFETAAGEALVVNLGSAVGIAGSLTYVEVPT